MPSFLLLARTDFAARRVALDDRFDTAEEIHDAGDFQPVEHLVAAFIVADNARHS